MKRLINTAGNVEPMDVADPDRDMSDEEISGCRGRGKDRIHQLAAIGRASGEE